MGFDVLVSFLFWVLPVMVMTGVIRQDGISTCMTYTLDGILTVDCSDRGLTELPDKLNYQAQKLLLSSNNFGSFSNRLNSFQELITLDLSNNHLDHALPVYISSLTYLKTLNLSNNNYASWISSGYSFTIRKLDLSKNKINAIDDAAIGQTPLISFLDLSENRIYDLPQTIFSDANHLETLILSRNYFSDVPIFQSRSLKHLSLSNCQIGSLKSDSLTSMTSLLTLDLSINQIEYIPDFFASFSLQELDLSYNLISTLSDKSFSSLPHLAALDLRGNEFKEVWSSSLFSSNQFLREIRVKGNRWSCEGFSVNLLLTYEYLTKEPAKVSDPSSLICYTPSNVSQLSWDQAYIRTWHPHESVDHSYLLTAIMIGVIIGIVVTSLICRGLMTLTTSEPQTTTRDTIFNPNGSPRSSTDSIIMRVPLRDEDQPPTYDEALLMPRLNASFHSLPDFIDEEEEPRRNYRRSRSFGDLTESRTIINDRRSTRRTVEIHIT